MILWFLLLSLVLLLGACSPSRSPEMPVLHWYVFDEPSGAFEEAAAGCSSSAYRVVLEPLPHAADQQREQLVRRLAARDPAVDLIGMDVIWTAEFASAGWLLAFDAVAEASIAAGRFPACVETARYRGRLWAVPYTTNAQLLWYRRDRIAGLPETWDDLLDSAERLATRGAIQVQGDRYEGLTVFFVSLLASSGGRVLDDTGRHVDLTGPAVGHALRIMKRLANSRSADPALSTAREDEARLAFESGSPTFMINYPFVWPSVRSNAPMVAAHMAWARWPAVDRGRPSRVTVGGLNLAISAYSRHPEQALRAAECLASIGNQRRAAELGGLPPTLEALYDDPVVRGALPFAGVLREALRDAVVRPATPLYSDLSLAIARTLHPMKDVTPTKTPARLRRSVARALRSEGLL